MRIIPLLILQISVTAFSLEISDRPEELKREIDCAFQKAKITSYRYYGNHDDDYGSSAFVYSRDILRNIIENAPMEQKDFYVVELGAGYGGYIDGTAEYLNNLNLKNDITIHLIGLTAQEDVPYKKMRIGNNINKYLIGHFNAENLVHSFTLLKSFGLIDNQLDFFGKIDLVVSQYTFIHLIDPLGTFATLYNNLRAGSGMMLVDNFNITINTMENESKYYVFKSIISLSNANFMTFEVPSEEFRKFLIAKPDCAPLMFPLEYSELRLRKNILSGEWKRASYKFITEPNDIKLKQYKYTTYQIEGNIDSDSLYERFFKSPDSVDISLVSPVLR